MLSRISSISSCCTNGSTTNPGNWKNELPPTPPHHHPHPRASTRKTNPVDWKNGSCQEKRICKIEAGGHREKSTSRTVFQKSHATLAISWVVFACDIYVGTAITTFYSTPPTYPPTHRSTCLPTRPHIHYQQVC